MANIILKAASPGHATLHISPWEEGTEGVELCVRRSEGDPYLNVATQQWVGDEQWLHLQGASLLDGTLLMPVGPGFVDTLLAGTQGPRCRGYVRVAGGEAIQHGFRVEADVLPSSAAGQAPTIGGNTQISASPVSEAPVAPVVPPSPPQPAPAVPVKKPSKSWLWLVILLVVLAAVAAAVYFFVFKNKSDVPDTTTKASSVASSCSVAGLANAGEDSMGFMQACVRDVKDAGELLTVIRAARDAGQCDIAQRLYANRANAGDVTITMAYAQEYDPATSRSDCFKPEASTARYWYDSILEKDPEHAEAKAKLQALPN